MAYSPGSRASVRRRVDGVWLDLRAIVAAKTKDAARYLVAEVLELR